MAAQCREVDATEYMQGEQQWAAHRVSSGTWVEPQCQLLEDVEVQIVIAVRRVVRVLQVAELRVDLLEDLNDLPGIPRRLRSVEVEELDAREGRVKADLKQ